MSTSQLRDRIAALRAEAAAVGAELAARGAGMGQEELFEVTGELQEVVNAVEGRSWSRSRTPAPTSCG